MNVDFRQQLIDIRAKYELSQKDMAKLAGIMPTTYRMIENGQTSEQSKTAKKVRKHTIDNEQKVEADFLKRRRKADKFRIPNIPNFYERLKEIADGEGRIRKELNPGVFKEIQCGLGVIERGGPTQRGEFSKLLKEFRGNIPQVEFAKRLGIKNGSYSAIERRVYGPKSDIMKGLLVNGYFTEEQRKKLTRVYKRMQKEEKK